jgi:hypothetical protein
LICPHVSPWFNISSICPRLSHLPSFDRLNRNWWKVNVQIVILNCILFYIPLFLLSSWIRTEVKYLPVIIEHSLSSSS